MMCLATTKKEEKEKKTHQTLQAVFIDAGMRESWTRMSRTFILIAIPVNFGAKTFERAADLVPKGKATFADAS